MAIDIQKELGFNPQQSVKACEGEYYNNKTPQGLEATLNCLSRQEPLGRLGGQWIILRKSHWVISRFASESTYNVANNYFDPNAKHQLAVKNPNTFSGDSLMGYLKHLEKDIFPTLLAGVKGGQAGLNTKFSFGATAHPVSYTHLTLPTTPYV